MSEVRVGPAAPEEREESYRLAYTVFCEEMGTLGEDADPGRRLVKDDLIERAHVIHARVGGEVVGSLGVLLGATGRSRRRSTAGSRSPVSSPAATVAR